MGNHTYVKRRKGRKQTPSQLSECTTARYQVLLPIFTQPWPILGLLDRFSPEGWFTDHHALYPLVTELIDSGPLLIQGPPGYWGTRMPSEGPEFQGAQRSLLHFLSKRYMNFWITEMDLPHHLNEPLCHHMNGPLCHLNGPLSPPEWTFITT